MDVIYVLILNQQMMMESGIVLFVNMMYAHNVLNDNHIKYRILHILTIVNITLFLISMQYLIEYNHNTLNTNYRVLTFNNLSFLSKDQLLLLKFYSFQIINQLIIIFIFCWKYYIKFRVYQMNHLLLIV